MKLEHRRLSFVRQAPIAVQYRGQAVGEGRLDFVVERLLVVELKAVEALAPIHTAQVLSYVKATGLHLGLLINFNVPVLRAGIKRVAH